MNVLFLSELFYPYGSGGELATGLYATLLSGAGFNVVVVTNSPTEGVKSSRKRNLTVYRLPLFKGSGSNKYAIMERVDVLLSGFMRKLMKWADLVYVPRFWYSAIPLAKAYGKQVIVHLHAYLPICPVATSYYSYKDKICDSSGLGCSPRCIYAFENTYSKRFGEKLASTTLNLTLGRSLTKVIGLSDAIVCVSEAQKSIISRRAPLLNSKIHVIYNPLPNLQYINNAGHDFGYFGGPNPLKGFHVLCRALKEINTKGLTVHATNFPNATENLNKISDKRRILFYKRLSDKSYNRLYEQIRAVLVPSIWPEPWGYVVLEALLQGRLVIASRTGGIPEQVENCKGAFLYEATNHNELADKMECVSGLSEEVAEDLRASNREIVMKKFTNEKTLRDFTRLCNELMRN